MKNHFIKHFAIMVLLVIIAIPATAQKIVYDNLDSKTGLRTISTDGITCRSTTDKVVLNVSLEAFIEKSDTTLCLEMELTSLTPISANKDSRMLIKLMDDSVIELSNMFEKDDHIGHSQVIGGAIYTSYSINPAYQLDEEQIEQIIELGVKKVRIESAPDYYDKEFKKDKVGEAVGKLYPVLREAIDTPKSFDADF